MTIDEARKKAEDLYYLLQRSLIRFREARREFTAGQISQEEYRGRAEALALCYDEEQTAHAAYLEALHRERTADAA